ncbi:MAG: hypothetical protein AB7S74_11675 [Hyphomicrobium sp.]
MTSASRTIAQTESLAPKVAGVAFASLFTAVFWVAMISLTGMAFGISFDLESLALVGCAIAAFLSGVCSPLMLRDTLEDY